MRTYLLRRCLYMLLILFGASILIFFLYSLTPGDYVDNNLNLSEQRKAELREIYGLNKPILERYVIWMSNLLRGDFGYSLAQQRPVLDLFQDYIWNSFLLASVATFFTWLLAVVIGVFTAYKQYSLFDTIVMIGIFAAMSIPSFFIGPLFSPYADGKINPAKMYQPPSVEHWLGTDLLGRDVLTRLLQAGRISLTVGLASMVLSMTIGTLLGIISGYYRGVVDQIIMRIADLLFTIPSLPILFIMGALMSEWKVPTDYRLYIVMIMLSLIGWPGVARLVRSQMLSLREREYMLAADVLGLRDRRKLFAHLLPNVFPLLIVIGTLSTGGAILSESVLSFFGLGVMPPTPTWGNMIDAANNVIDFEKRPWLWIPPGLAIFLTVISINIFGDGLRDVLDPKQNTSR